jgi:hypothetical protein
MQQITLKSLVKQGHVTGVSLLRRNENGYPYVTLLKGNKSNNVYFGKKTSEIISSTFEIGDKVAAALKDATVIKATNAAGQMRYKLSLSGTTEYTTTAELMDIFGVEEEVADFDVAEFLKEFSAVSSTSPISLVKD